MSEQRREEVHQSFEKENVKVHERLNIETIQTSDIKFQKRGGEIALKYFQHIHSQPNVREKFNGWAGGRS